MRTTLTRAILGAAGVLALTAAVAPAAGASITPNTTFKIESTFLGGCWKDQGGLAAYTVSACATASNFHLVNGSGVYAELKDGSGFCAQETTEGVEAASCVDGSTIQEWIHASDGTLYTEHDNGTGNYAVKGSVSPYYVLIALPNQQNGYWTFQ